jgi:hypothetical protein
MSWRSPEIQLQSRVGGTLALTLLLFGCGEDQKPQAEETPAVEVTGEPLSTYEPCAVEQDLGGFSIRFAEDFTSVGGNIEDRVNPGALTTELARDGACRLVSPQRFNCDPPCDTATQQCSIGDACVPPPQRIDLGTISVTGLSAPASMTPSALKNYSLVPPVPHPGYEPGASITLTTAGGELDPITLQGWGVSLFELSEVPRVDPGMATALRWMAPADPGPAQVTVRLEINLHGSNKGSIECDFPDTGAAEIPATLIDGLIARGVTGFPTITVTRRSASSTQIEPGCVEFLVYSELATPVEVAGLTSCNEGTPCPDGRMCRALEMFCE